MVIINRKLCGCVLPSMAQGPNSKLTAKNKKELMIRQDNLHEPSCPLWFKFLVNEKRAAMAAARWETLVQLLPAKILGVLVGVFFPFFRQIVQRENS